MDSRLAAMMLDWEVCQLKADELKTRIEAEVLAIGKTQTVGNVRATYSAGRRAFDYTEGWRAHGYGTGVDIEKFKDVTYDYETAWEDEHEYPPGEEYQRIIYDYRAAVKAAGIVDTDIPCTQSPPSVNLKLLA